MSKYKWAQPMYFSGELVTFIDSWGKRRDGEIVDVETWYDYHNNAHHNYSIHIKDKDAKRRLFSASQENILGFAPKVS